MGRACGREGAETLIAIAPFWATEKGIRDRGQKRERDGETETMSETETESCNSLISSVLLAPSPPRAYMCEEDRQSAEERR